MPNKNVVGVVVGVAVVATIIYIAYLNIERKKLEEENERLKPKPLKKSPVIINLDSVPKPIRGNFSDFANHINYDHHAKSFKEAYERVLFLKEQIEIGGAYQLLYRDGKRITREKDTHLLYSLTWFQTNLDVNREVNNGRGAVDFKVSEGLDQTIVEFKLASNTKLKMNLHNQIEIYARANHNPHKIIVIFFFTEKEQQRVKSIIAELSVINKKYFVMIDARNDNKQSASTVKLQPKKIQELLDARAV